MGVWGWCSHVAYIDGCIDGGSCCLILMGVWGWCVMLPYIDGCMGMV